MDKNDIIEYVMNTPHNTNRAVLSSMLNQLGGGGSGDGYLGLHTATVNVTFDTSEVGEDISSISRAYINLGYNEEYGNSAIQFIYGDNIPVTELGTPTQMVLPVSDEYPIHLNYASIEYLTTGGSGVLLSEATVISGSASGSISSDDFTITGDCSINFKVAYQE